jgi:hypothetical protein
MSVNWLALACCVLTTVAESPPRSLPNGPIIASYAYQCDNGGAAKVLKAVKNGVNVVVWFAVDLAKNSSTGEPYIGHDDAQNKVSNWTCIAEVVGQINALNLPTAHLLSIGGWAAPHPDTSFTGAQWWQTFRKFNDGLATEQAALGFRGFDGIDWDLEGANNASSPINFFTPECIELVGTMSQAAKRDGYLVSMVPPESYLDPTTSHFDLSLLHTYPGGQYPTFKYHSVNSYAVFLAKYGTTNVPKSASGDNQDASAAVDTFDIIDIQLYETCSHCAYHLNIKAEDPVQYLVNYTALLLQQGGWTVKFSEVLT